MKKFVTTLTLSILMASSLSSCGKKANDNKSEEPKDVVEGIQANLIEETHKELQAAIIAQNKGKVEDLLEMRNQLDLDKILDNGETLLTLAVKINHRGIVEVLLESGSKVSASNSRKETPLMVAAKLGFFDLLKLLIAQNAKLDFKDINGNTALHLAILNRHEDIALYLLIDAKANYEITNALDKTPLALAEMLNLTKIADALRAKTVSWVSKPDESAIINLLRLGDKSTLQMLFIKYDSLATSYPNLNYYVEVINSNTNDKALELINFLMLENISIHGPMNTKETPLLAAVKKDVVHFANIFLEGGVNTNVLDESGKSALIWAIQRNNPAMVELLVNYNAAEKYDYFLNGKKKTMKACDIVKDVKKLVASDPAAKKANADIKDILDCGFLGLF